MKNIDVWPLEHDDVNVLVSARLKENAGVCWCVCWRMLVCMFSGECRRFFGDR